jgi:hypothetical protein
MVKQGVMKLISHEKYKLHSAGILAYEDEYQKQLLEGTTHIFKGMVGPEQLVLRNECLVCSQISFLRKDVEFEFVFSVKVGGTYEDHDLIGHVCSCCVDLPMREKHLAIANRIRPKG